MDLGLDNKVAVVTAASRGMGKATAIRLAHEGAKVAICSRSSETMQKVADEISQAAGQEVFWHACDLTKASDIQVFIDDVVAHFGGVDILVANAGGPPRGDFFAFSDKDWDAAFQLTFMSVVRLIRAAVPSMRQRGGGRIVTISSSSVKQPIPDLILSNAVRAGVLGLIKSLAEELAPDGILVNNFSPGRINTERLQMNDEAMAKKSGKSVDEIRKASFSRIPLGRYGDVEEVADTITFMVSERASYITGTTILGDGGLVKALH